MNEDMKVEFLSDVIVIDAAYLNTLAANVRGHFGRVLGREIETLDMARFVTCLMYDAWGEEAPKDRMVLIVYDKKSCRMDNCTPSDIAAELDGKAFRSACGEFQFSGVAAENIVGREELMADLLTLVADSKRVERLIVVADEESYGAKIDSIASSVDGKDIARFVMRESSQADGFRNITLAYPIMIGLAIRGDELK